jgi:hypothetical protein
MAEADDGAEVSEGPLSSAAQAPRKSAKAATKSGAAKTPTPACGKPPRLRTRASDTEPPLGSGAAPCRAAEHRAHGADLPSDGSPSRMIHGSAEKEVVPRAAVKLWLRRSVGARLALKTRDEVGPG